MSSNTKELLERLTTSCTLPVEGFVPLMKQRQDAYRCLLENEKGKQYGKWTVLDRPIPLGLTKKLWVRCECGTEKLTNYFDLTYSKSTQCRACSDKTHERYTHVPRKQRHQLQMRYNAIQGRVKANKFTSRTYANVENRFTSCEHFVTFMWATYPMDDYTGWEVDRIDTNKHYEPSNVRLVTREQNAQTRNVNVMVEYNGELMSASKFQRDYCKKLGKDQVADKLKSGMTPQQIVDYAQSRTLIWVLFKGQKMTRSKFCKQYVAPRNPKYVSKNWDTLIQPNGEISIAGLLKYTTLSKQEAETVSVITE